MLKPEFVRRHYYGFLDTPAFLVGGSSVALRLVANQRLGRFSST